MTEIISSSINQTKEVASEILKNLKKRETAEVVGLHGNLGSGKTTFTKAIAELLGVSETVSSPTFVIEKIYPIRNSKSQETLISNGTSKSNSSATNQNFSHLIHIDAYRLKSGAELTSLGLQEILKDENNLILIEWPENVLDVLPENSKHIYFEFVDENTRKITYGK